MLEAEHALFCCNSRACNKKNWRQSMQNLCACNNRVYNRVCIALMMHLVIRSLHALPVAGTLCTSLQPAFCRGCIASLHLKGACATTAPETEHAWRTCNQQPAEHADEKLPQTGFIQAHFHSKSSACTEPAGRTKEVYARPHAAIIADGQTLQEGVALNLQGIRTCNATSLRIAMCNHTVTGTTASATTIDRHSGPLCRYIH